MARIITHITTRYVALGYSNVGGHRATGLGRQRSVRSDQALSSDANHRRAAERVARAILAEIPGASYDEVALTEIESNDAGTERRWAMTKVGT